MNVYIIDDGECHWFVATDEHDAREQFALLCTQQGWQIFENLQIAQLAPTKMLTINADDDRITQTAAEWAKHEGRGYLGSSCF